MAKKRDPSSLPGSHRDRVFIGGSYKKHNVLLLKDIKREVRNWKFTPIFADDFELRQQDRDVHDVTLWLLHACRLAIFEVSIHSGALMELERVNDYGIYRVLLLYQNLYGRDWRRDPSAWDTTEMLKSWALEQSTLGQRRCVVRPYASATNALQEVSRFLEAIRRSPYGELHSL
jgi:hypothetical protein